MWILEGSEIVGNGVNDELIRKQDALDAVSKALDRQTLLYGFVRKVALDAIKIVPPVRQDFDLAEKMDKAYDYGYEAGYLQAKHDWGNMNG